ncbi:MAG: phosphoribosyltransferase regulatory subunit [Burkholderiaceae bacterium]|nr:phosphoribosyltransferase regulatory subunit [Burkholderiaceae bacterium]
MQNWLLPEYIADVLPAEARKIEDLRRVILDNFRLYGYELVMPPMLEYLESLLSSTGQDTDLFTFRLIDQLSGRTMGIRADMTTQVARIDAHLLNRSSVTRLCYAGSVLHARPSGLYATREPFQIGAEIYGHGGLESDAEIQELALASLQLAGISGVCINLCHVGVIRDLLASEPKLKKVESELFNLLEGKDVAGLSELTKGFDAKLRAALLALPGLYGGVAIIAEARKVLPPLPGIVRALDEIEALARMAESDGVSVTVDLADLGGYQYHSGVMFAAYVPGLPNALARGGRYDHVGEVFGRARPATGFSMDLRELARLVPCGEPQKAIRAPWGKSPELREKIKELRQNGEVVIQSLPGQGNDQDEFDCDRELAAGENGGWVLKKLV